jgi:hypothetical protein
VGIKKIALVASGGRWEKGNLDTVVRIAREFAEDVNVDRASTSARRRARS